jgi:hypothetical protein
MLPDTLRHCEGGSLLWREADDDFKYVLKFKELVMG